MTALSLMFKVTEEEKRYAKAYGTGALEFEQFTELMNDAESIKKHVRSNLAS